MHAWEVDALLSRERNAVAQSNITIHRSRDTVARAKELVNNTKALIARARQHPRRQA